MVMKGRTIRGGPIVGILLLVFAGCALTGDRGRITTADAAVSFNVDVGYFHDELSPYGRWVNVSYGQAWVPRGTYTGWRPYTNGYWQYTDYGWTWASNEPWGWATYHYGRWYYDPFYGWAWVPDTVWGPAWVAWRTGDDWVGWAPLPPAAGWSVNAGFTGGSVINRIPSSQWCFVEGSHWTDRNVRVRLLPATQNVTLISRTRNVTNIGVSGDRAVNRSIDVATAERLTRSRVQRVSVADAPRQIQVPRQVQAQRQGQSHGRTQGNDQKRLDSFLRDEHRRLQTQQADEMRAAQRSQDRSELQRRHQAENKAFEQHATRERQQMKQSGRPSYEPFDRTTVQSSPAKPANGNKGQGKNNGQGASNKGHGKSG